MDQKSDVTLEKIYCEATGIAPEESDGYFFTNGIFMHHNYLTNERNGTRYVDRIVVPESYRNEIQWVGHTILLSGHMGRKKTLECITAHFIWPGLHFDICKYCATCPQCQVVARKLNSVTKMDAYPIPSMEKMMEKIASAKYISTIDLTKGYWQIPLETSTIEKSAINYHKRVVWVSRYALRYEISPSIFPEDDV